MTSRDSQPTRRRGRIATLSRDAVVQAAINILDTSGSKALTFRSLAAALDTGVGSLYHYVSGKDELMDLAANHVLGEILARESRSTDPFDVLKELSLALFEAMRAHSWLGGSLFPDFHKQPNWILLFERFGQQLMGYELTPAQRFNAVSTLFSFVTGFGADMSEAQARHIGPDTSQEQALQDFASSWQELDAESHPFISSITDIFASHDELEQFTEGVEIILAGIKAQI